MPSDLLHDRFLGAAGCSVLTSDLPRDPLLGAAGCPALPSDLPHDPSLGAAGSHLDRHENIGRGRIGRAGIARVLADPRFQRLPVVLETPYVDDDIYRREIKLLYDMMNT